MSNANMVMVPGSPLSQEEYTQLFNMLMPQGRAEAVCQIRLLSGCENPMIIQLDKYENHGEIPDGIICSDFSDAPYFTDFCTFTHYRCTRKRYYIRRVNCPDNSLKKDNIMTHRDSLLDHKGSVEVTSTDEGIFSLDNSWLRDENPTGEVIPDEEMMLHRISSQWLGGSDVVTPSEENMGNTIFGPGGRWLTPKASMKGRVPGDMLHGGLSQQFGEIDLPMPPNEGMMEDIPYRPDGRWLTPEVIRDTMAPEDLNFHSGMSRWLSRNDATLSKGIMENPTSSPGKWWPTPKVNEEAMVSDEENLFGSGINWQAGGRDVQVKPKGQIVEGDIFPAARLPLSPQSILNGNPYENIGEGQIFTRGMRWWIPRRVLKATLRKGTLEAMQRGVAKGIIFGGTGGWPTPEFDAEGTVLDEDAMFTSGISRQIGGLDAQVTSNEKLAEGMLFRRGRRKRIPKRMAAVMPRERSTEGPIPGESPEWNVDLTIPDKETILSRGLHQQMLGAMPRHSIMEGLIPVRSLEQNVDIMIPGQEMPDNIPEIMPREIIWATTIPGEEEIWSHDVDQWTKQRTADLMLKAKTLEIEPRGSLVEMLASYKVLRPWPTGGIAEGRPRDTIAVETIPDEEEMIKGTPRPGIEGRRVAVEIPEDEKVYSHSVSLETTERNTRLMSSLVTQEPPCHDTHGAHLCTPPAKQQTSRLSILSASDSRIISSPNKKQWVISSRSKLTWPSLPSPSHQSVLDQKQKVTITSMSAAQNRNGGVDMDSEKLLNDLLTFSYGDNVDYKPSNGTSNWGAPKGMLRVNLTTLTWKQNISRTSSSTVTRQENFLGTLKGWPGWRGPHPASWWSRYSTLDPGRVTLVRSNSGGEIWRGDMVDLYQRLQDPKVQKLSKELQEKLAQKVTPGIGDTDLQDLSIRLMKALSHVRMAQ